MTQASDIRTQFNGGELSPLMEGRVDFNKYNNACRKLENFIPTVQGAAKRRQGSRYVATTRNTGQRVWFKSFQASNQEQYVLEFGDHYIRFYTNHGILLSGGAPYEVGTPYSSAELTSDELTCTLDTAQSNDVMYIVHANHAPCKLTRTGVGTFTFTQNAIGVDKSGPFKDLNADMTITLSASGDGTDGSLADDTNGTLSSPYITLEATSGIFTDGMVGKYFYIQEGNSVLVPQWEYDKSIAVGVRRRSNSINYIAVTGTGTTNTGNVKPTHLEGVRFDGDMGVQWAFTDDGSGVVLITSLIGAQPTSQVNATVVKRLPYSVTQYPGGSTHRWAAAAWTDNDGFPDSVCFFRERSTWARGQSIWMSVAGDFENFSTRDGGQVLADSAIIMTIAADKKDRIQWLQPESSLVVGTASGEFAVAEYTNGSPLGPANVRAQRQSAFGSKTVPPITIGAAILFVEKGGRRVREMSYDIRQSQYLSVDVTVLSEHITKATGISPSQRINSNDGIIAWTFAQRPDHVVWAARADGVLLGLTYNREQDVTAWHRHKIGYQIVDGLHWGQVECVCAIGSPDGTQDDLWLVVKRGDARHVEYIGQPVQTEIMNTPWGGATPGGFPNNLGLTPQQLASTALWELDAFYVDSGLSRVPSITYAPMTKKKVIYLTSGSTWNVPSDFTDHNSVECIGAGGMGNSGRPSGGGGGGAYSKKNNLTLTGAITYKIGQSDDNATPLIGDTCFGGTTLATSTVSAQGGIFGGGTGGVGGAASSGVGTVKSSGGHGGAGGGNGGTGAGGGGGGAGGPHYNGSAGGDAFNSGDYNSEGGGGGGGGITAGAVGEIDHGGAGGTTGGNGGYAEDMATAGSTDPVFDDPNYGIGGGGGGAGYAVGTSNNAGAGGPYGGGGGGGLNGFGGQGLIVITYYTIDPDVVTTVSGLDHLEGLTVQIVADGSPHPDRVVIGGSVTLTRPAFSVHVGLKCPAILETTQLNSGSQDGTAQGKIKRIQYVTARFFESKGGYIGPDAEHLEQFRYRDANALMDSYIPFFTGDERMDFPGSFEKQSRIYILQDSAFPMTVVALMPSYVTRERQGI